MLLMEFDKAGAEWVIVAYVSGDAQMMNVIETGKSPHVVTGHLMTGVPEDLVLKENKIVDKHTDPDLIEELRRAECPEIFDLATKFLPRTMSVRQAGKKSNHGLNYGMRYRMFALLNEVEEREAKMMVDLYNKEAYPGIPLWHEGIRRELRNNDRTLYNLFGSKVRLLGEWGDDLFNAAYSYIPQSTNGELVNQAICQLYEDDSPAFLPADLLTQTHDSATIQYPTRDFLQMAEFAVKFTDYLSPELSYHGRNFKIGTDLKVGLNWGHMHEVKLTNNVEELAHALERTYISIREELR